MRSKIVSMVVFGMLFSLVFATAGLTEDSPKFSDNIVPESLMCFPLKLTFKRPEETHKSNFAAVKFSHGDHGEYSCTTCHHMWDGESEIMSCASEGCHDVFADRHDSQSYFQAFHNRHAENSCLGCHTAYNKKLKEEGKDQLQISSCVNNICHKKG